MFILFFGWFPQLQIRDGTVKAAQFVYSFGNIYTIIFPCTGSMHTSSSTITGFLYFI